MQITITKADGGMLDVLVKHPVSTGLPSVSEFGLTQGEMAALVDAEAKKEGLERPPIRPVG